MRWPAAGCRWGPPRATPTRGRSPGEADPGADDWNRLGLLAATLRQSDLESGVGADLLHKLFAEDDVRVFTPRTLAFHCKCSRKRAAEVLRLLGEADTRSACKEQGRIDVTCEYCGRTRRFDAVDVAKLFASEVGPASDTVH
jgi:molecular chaperone Hsp33